MPNLSAPRKMLNFACLFLMITFIIEKIFSIPMLNEYIQNLLIPLLTIIINVQTGSAGENANGNNAAEIEVNQGENNHHEEVIPLGQAHDEGRQGKVIDINKLFKKKK